jgi:hypothetical protein
VLFLATIVLARGGQPAEADSWSVRSVEANRHGEALSHQGWTLSVSVVMFQPDPTGDPERQPHRDAVFQTNEEVLTWQGPGGSPAWSIEEIRARVHSRGAEVSRGWWAGAPSSPAAAAIFRVDDLSRPESGNPWLNNRQSLTALMGLGGVRFPFEGREPPEAMESVGLAFSGKESSKSRISAFSGSDQGTSTPAPGDSSPAWNLGIWLICLALGGVLAGWVVRIIATRRRSESVADTAEPREIVIEDPETEKPQPKASNRRESLLQRTRVLQLLSLSDRLLRPQKASQRLPLRELLQAQCNRGSTSTTATPALSRDEQIYWKRLAFSQSGSGSNAGPDDSSEPKRGFQGIELSTRVKALPVGHSKSEANEADLSQLLGSWEREAGRQAELLDQAVTRLRELGIPPGIDLLERLAAGNQRFARLRERVRHELEAVGLRPSRDELADLPGLVHAWDRIQAVRKNWSQFEAERDGAQEILEKVLALRPRHARSHSSLEACQVTARSLKATISATQPSALPNLMGSLAQAIPPYADLLQLALEPDALDDRAWASAFDRVATTFGQNLAAAAVRGRFGLIKPALQVKRVG